MNEKEENHLSFDPNDNDFDMQLNEDEQFDKCMKNKLLQQLEENNWQQETLDPYLYQFGNEQEYQEETGRTKQKSNYFKSFRSSIKIIVGKFKIKFTVNGGNSQV